MVEPDPPPPPMEESTTVAVVPIMNPETDPPPPPCPDCNGRQADLKCETCKGEITIYRNMKYVRDLMDISYNSRDSVISTSMDLLALYMQGQKILYTESKVYCEQQLNMLMLPAILISALCTLLSVSLKDLTAGVYIVSGLAACNSFILSVVSYLKLDAKAEAHKTAAYQFDKLQTMCEFNSGKVLFFKKDAEPTEETKDKIIKIVEDIEAKVKEIKDTNKFILPEYVRFGFKNLYEQNIFSDVKVIQINETIKLSEVREKLNRIIYLKSLPDSPDNEEKIRVATTEKDQAIRDVILLRMEFFRICERTKHEVRKNIEETRKYKFIDVFCGWLKT
uniref:Uncharacterized protein n=1 Tax=viral metagenome TaxID=1070528 RepID=A0A6C0AIS6_9ZZZZ